MDSFPRSEANGLWKRLHLTIWFTLQRLRSPSLQWCFQRSIKFLKLRQKLIIARAHCWLRSKPRRRQKTLNSAQLTLSTLTRVSSAKEVDQLALGKTSPCSWQKSWLKLSRLAQSTTSQFLVKQTNRAVQSLLNDPNQAIQDLTINLSLKNKPTQTRTRTKTTGQSKSVPSSTRSLLPKTKNFFKRSARLSTLLLLTLPSTVRRWRQSRSVASKSSSTRCQMRRHLAKSTQSWSKSLPSNCSSTQE